MIDLKRLGLVLLSCCACTAKSSGDRHDEAIPTQQDELPAPVEPEPPSPAAPAPAPEPEPAVPPVQRRRHAVA